MSGDNMIIKNLISLANELDKRKLKKEADCLDALISLATEMDESDEGTAALMLNSGLSAGDAPDEPAAEASAAKLYFPIERHQWQEDKERLREHEVGPELEQRDLTAMQGALDSHSGSEGSSGYLVIDPFNNEDFQKYVQRAEDSPDGKEVVVPLNTFALAGARINYFKTVHTNKYGF